MNIIKTAIVLLLITTFYSDNIPEKWDSNGFVAKRTNTFFFYFKDPVKEKILVKRNKNSFSLIGGGLEIHAHDNKIFFKALGNCRGDFKLTYPDFSKAKTTFYHNRTVLKIYFPLKGLFGLGPYLL